MLAIFDGAGEVLVCEVDSEGKPKTGDYFTADKDSRLLEDYDLTLVEAPVMVTRGEMKVEPERELSRT